MRCLILAAFCSLLLFSSGCSGTVRMDTSSDEALSKSSEKMVAGMTNEQKMQFMKDCTDIVFPEMMKEFQKGFSFTDTKQKAPATMSQMHKPLEGLTAAEIHSKAEEVRARLPKKQ